MTGSPTTRSRVPRLHLSVALKWSIALSALATVLIFTLLWVQMALGNDPALGPKIDRQRRTANAAATQTAQQTLIPVAPEGYSYGYDDEGYATVPAAPQPAPAPAPVQTSTS